MDPLVSMQNMTLESSSLPCAEQATRCPQNRTNRKPTSSKKVAQSPVRSPHRPTYLDRLGGPKNVVHAASLRLLLGADVNGIFLEAKLADPDSDVVLSRTKLGLAGCIQDSLAAVTENDVSGVYCDTVGQFAKVNRDDVGVDHLDLT